jgi:hypothetical protein
MSNKSHGLAAQEIEKKCFEINRLASEIAGKVNDLDDKRGHVLYEMSQITKALASILKTLGHEIEV